MRNLLIGAILAGAAWSASAQPVQEPRGYIGASYGVSKYDIDFCNDALPPGFSCDDSGQSWRVQAGYHILPWLAIEAAYLHFGEATLPGILLNPPPNTTPLPSEGTARTFGGVISAVGRVPLGAASLFAKVGYGAITAKFVGNAAVQDNTTGVVTFFNSQARKTRGEFVYGLGATVNFAPSWHARFDWDHVQAKDSINPEYDVDMFTLGFGYRF